MKSSNLGKTKTLSKTKRVFFAIFISILCLIALACAGTITYLFLMSKNLDFDENLLRQVNAEMLIFDSENNSLSESNSQKSKVKLCELPDYVPASFLSIEDKNFYSHHGLNYKRILKAMYRNIKSHSFSEGASTISQQLIKNTHLSSDKTFDRKIKEMLLTLKMEKKMSKNEILETYLNAIYFGNGAYGLDNASKIYFDKPAKNLTIAESAMLAGIIKSPKTYSPVFETENCLNRRNLVLKEMLNDKIISSDDYQKAIVTPIKINNKVINNQNFYEKAVLEEASEKLNISEKELATKGYYIFTYLDKNIQSSLTKTVNDSDFYHQNSFGNIADSAGIVIDNKTGGIVAFDGKSVYDIVNMKRSPGSSIKPILVYAPALESGVISPISPILDEPTHFGSYTPQNVGGKYYGYISSSESVEKSLNIPAIKIMQANGIEKSKDMAKKCGINFDKTDTNYAIALGGMTNGVTVKELVNSYIPLSNNGQFFQAQFIRKICDKNGNVIYENKPQKTTAMSEETAYLMTEMLIGGVKKGTSARLSSLDYEVAGKTGTVGIKNTNLNSDVWSVAYTTSHTVGMWLGNSTGSQEYMLEGANNGGTFCTSMIKSVMQDLYATSKPKDFEKPSGIVSVELDSQELENNHAMMLADSNTPEIFKTKADFNKKYAPTMVAKSFSELKAVHLNATMQNKEVKLSFTALPQVEYKIYRIFDDEFKLIDTIKNKKGEVEVLDKDLEENCFYTYYIEACAKNHATNTLSKRIRSNSVKVFASENKPEKPSNQNEKPKSKKFWFFG